jgi:energy-coupling factor transporter ATP-binding protein EcfA2
MENNELTSIRRVYLSRITVKKLFGLYDYDLRLNAVDIAKPTLAIFYGDNGTGKTTILHLVFHLLCSTKSQGHKSYIGRMPFREFSVYLTNGTAISIRKTSESFVGPYKLLIQYPNGELLQVHVKADQDGRVPGYFSSKEYNLALDTINRQNISLLFLTDERKSYRNFYVDKLEEKIDQELLDRHENYAPDTEENRLRYSLYKVFERASTWIRQKAINDATRGENDSQNIFAEIVDSISNHGLNLPKDHNRIKEFLILELDEIRNRSSVYSRIGLMSEIETNRLKNSLEKSDSNSLPYVANIVSTYIAGQKARLAAFNELSFLLQRFSERINSLLLNKYLDIHVSRGIRILLTTGNILALEKLSSGEKQLFMLFLNILTSSTTSSLFMIDEPEISLNIKWQRQLIEAMFEIAGDNPCQFILATHSIEILSRYNDMVVPLSQG